MAAIWRCPDCETLNSGNKCVVCGKTRPESDNKEQPTVKYVYDENREKTEKQQKNKNTLQYYENNEEITNKPQIQTVMNHNSYSKPFGFVIVLLVLVMILLMVSVFLLIRGGKNSSESVLNTETAVSVVSETVSSVEQTNNTTVSEYEQSVFETEVAVIASETTGMISEAETTSVTLPETTSEVSEEYNLSSNVNTVFTTTAAEPPKTVSQTTSATTVQQKKEWTEHTVNKVMYITQACYSHLKPISSSEFVGKYTKGEMVYVSAITDTSYYKL